MPKEPKHKVIYFADSYAGEVVKMTFYDGNWHYPSGESSKYDWGLDNRFEFTNFWQAWADLCQRRKKDPTHES